MRLPVAILSALALIAIPAGATSAARCPDSHGKFVKCPAKVAPQKPVRCRDAKGK